MISRAGMPIGNWPPLKVSGPVPPAVPMHQSVQTRRIYRFIFVQTFSIIYLQKFAIPVPGLPPVSLLVLIMMVNLGYLLITLQLRISMVRACIYGLLVAAVSLSHMLVETDFSTPSLMLLLVFSSEFIISWQVDWVFYRKLLSIFLNLMVFAALLVLLQVAWHAATGQTINIERLVPKFLLLPGYNYEAPIQFGSSYIRPNGVFMLEPSLISLLLGAAFLTDLTYFRDFRRLLLFGAALVGCMAATGFVLLAIAAPFLLVKQSRRFLMVATTICMVLAVVAVPFGLADRAVARFDELNSDEVSKSSAGQRIAIPADAMVTVLGDPHFLFTGMGAGVFGTAETNNTLRNPWPMVKLAKEYGIVVMVLYMTLFLVSVARCPNLPLVVGLLFLFHFTGGYLLDAAGFELIVILCTICTPVGPSMTDLPAANPI